MNKGTLGNTRDKITDSVSALKQKTADIFGEWRAKNNASAKQERGSKNATLPLSYTAAEDKVFDGLIACNLAEKDKNAYFDALDEYVRNEIESKNMTRMEASDLHDSLMKGFLAKLESARTSFLAQRPDAMPYDQRDPNIFAKGEQSLKDMKAYGEKQSIFGKIQNNLLGDMTRMIVKWSSMGQKSGRQSENIFDDEKKRIDQTKQDITKAKTLDMLLEQYKKQLDEGIKKSRNQSRERINGHLLDSYRNLFQDTKRYGQTKADMLGKREILLRQGFDGDQKWVDQARPLYNQALNEVYGGSHITQSSQSKPTSEQDEQQRALNTLSQEQRDEIRRQFSHAIYQDFLVMKDRKIDKEYLSQYIENGVKQNDVYGLSEQDLKMIYEDAFQKAYGHAFAQAEIQSDNDGDGIHSHVDHASESPDGMIHLDLVDVEPYLDIFADQLAMSDYDQKMEDISKEGFFKRLVKRAVHRNGRGAYIQSQKEEIKRGIREQLRDGTLHEDDIIDFVKNSDDSIQGGSYLDFEKIQKPTIRDATTKQIIVDVLSTPAVDRAARTEKLKELKSALELQSGSLLELNQLDRALQRVETALIGVDLRTTDIGLNLFDIGRVGNERGETQMKNNVPKSGISRFLNKLDQKIGSAGPIASRVSGILRHPTTAAIAATAAVTASSISFNTLTKALTLGLIPGSLVGGVVAAHRSKREELDRQVLIARGKTTLNARKENKILTEKQNKLDTLINQHSITDMYLKVIDPALALEERQETALLYLAKRESTKLTGINWLKYDGEGNSTEQNTRMLMAINSGDLGGKNWYKVSPNTDYIATIVISLKESAQEIYKKREEFARKYGNMEGLKFAAVGYGVGLGIGGILAGVQGAYHGIMGDTNISVPSHMPTSSNTIVAPTPIHTSSITPLSHIDRVWMDNNTHTFDGNELRLWKDSSGGFEVSHMFGHSSSHGHLSDIVRSGDAVGLVTVNGKVYEVAIDVHGKLLPSTELSTVLGNSSFQHLEIAKHVGGKYEIFASIRGSGTGVLTPVIVPNPLPAPIPESVPTPTPSGSWLDKIKDVILLPFGANKYHETTKGEKGSRIKVPPMPKPTKHLGESDHSDDPIPPVEPIPTPTPDPVSPSSPPPPTVPIKDSSDDMDGKEREKVEHEKDLRTKLDELFGRRRDFDNRSGKEGPHETHSEDHRYLDRKILGLQEELKTLGVKDIPTWDDYLKNNTVGPIPKISHKSENEKTEGKSDKAIDAKKDVNTIYGDRIAKLIAEGDVMRDSKQIPRIGFIDSNRPYIVMKTKSGMAVPFYRSSQGTSGKKKGKWFPFFGVSPDWVIKGNKAQHDHDYFSPEIARLSKLVNESLDYPHSIDTDNMRKSHPFDSFDIRKSKYNSYGIPVLNTPKPIDEKDDNASPYIQEYIDRINGVSFKLKEPKDGIEAQPHNELKTIKDKIDKIFSDIVNSQNNSVIQESLTLGDAHFVLDIQKINPTKYLLNFKEITGATLKDAQENLKQALRDIGVRMVRESLRPGSFWEPLNGKYDVDERVVKSPKVLTFEEKIKENIAKIGSVLSGQTAERFNREILSDIAKLEGRDVSEYQIDVNGNRV